MDHDIIGTEASIKQAEGSVGHAWNPTENKNGGWNVPTALAPQALATMGDRPSCSTDDGFPSAIGYCPKTIAARKE